MKSILPVCTRWHPHVSHLSLSSSKMADWNPQFGSSLEPLFVDVIKSHLSYMIWKCYKKLPLRGACRKKTINLNLYHWGRQLHDQDSRCLFLWLHELYDFLYLENDTNERTTRGNITLYWIPFMLLLLIGDKHAICGCSEFTGLFLVNIFSTDCFRSGAFVVGADPDGDNVSEAFPPLDFH